MQEAISNKQKTKIEEYFYQYNFGVVYDYIFEVIHTLDEKKKEELLLYMLEGSFKIF